MSESSPIQVELDKELRRLQARFGYGGSLKVLYIPPPIKIRQLGENKIEHGRVDVDSRKIIIRDETLSEALDVLWHEYFEYLLDKEMIRPYVDLINDLSDAYKLVINKLQYRNKEALLQVLIDVTRKEYGECNKRR